MLSELKHNQLFVFVLVNEGDVRNQHNNNTNDNIKKD